MPAAAPTGELDDTSRGKLDGIVQQMQSNKESDQNIQAVVNDFKQKYSSTSAPPPAAPSLPYGRMAAGNPFGDALKLGQQAIGQIGAQFNSGLAQYKASAPTNMGGTNAIPKDVAGLQRNIQAGEGALGVGAGIANMAFSPLAPVFKPIGDAINAIGTFAGQHASPQATKFAMSPAGQTTSRVAQDVVNASTVAGALSPLKRSLPAVKDTLSSLATRDARSGIPPPPSPPGASSAIISNYYNRAVKPTISGKTTAADTAAYQTKTTQAVNTIAQNKANLSFITEDGAKESARLPQNLNEFSQSIDQTKKSIYSQYDTLAQQAGDKGATVDPASITKELQGVVDNKSLQLSHPEAAKYAQSQIDRYTKFGPIDAKTAQGVIENYNAELQAFYRNPTYNQASHVAIDAAIVKGLRSSLDDVITKSTGTKYQTLRNQYASLKTIEGDVTKAANRVARLNNKGLADYTDIFSGGDIAAGILTLNPALFAKGIAQHGIKTWFKGLNSPDKAISHMFSKADQPSLP